MQEQDSEAHQSWYFFYSSPVYSFLPVIPIVDNKVTPVWNVIGVIPGHIKDEVVLVGNHRDGEY